MSETPPKSERSNGAIFVDALTSRTKRYDSWNDSHEWQRSGLPKTWMNSAAAMLGFFGLVVVPLAIAAVVLGHLGVRAASRGEASWRPFGVAGLVLGYVSPALWGGFLLLAMGDAAGWIDLF